MSTINTTLPNAPWNAQKAVHTSRDLVTMWLTTDEITSQLNLFGDDSQDVYLESLELATRMTIEDYLGVPIFANSFAAYYKFSENVLLPIYLALPQHSQSGVTINAVKYYNTAATPVLTTINAANYFYDVTGAQVILTVAPNDVNAEMAAPLEVTWTNAASVLGQYPVIKQAALLLIAHLYNQRADTSERKLHNIPFGLQALLRPYKPLVM
jgi:hypothetical protein